MRPMIALVVLAAALAAGCGPSQQYLLYPETETGHEFDYSIVPYLIEGSTTKAEVLDLLGEPFVIDRTDGRDIWHYYFRRTRDRYGEDWTGRIVAADEDAIEEHAATLVFANDVLWRVDERAEALMFDEPWVRRADPDPGYESYEYGPQAR